MTVRLFWVALALVATSRTGLAQNSRQATGVKVGEVTPTSAIVWIRLTDQASHNLAGEIGATTPGEAIPEVEVNKLRGACLGADGQVRLRYGLNQAVSDGVATEWITVSAETDFTHEFSLANLRPGTLYYFQSETQGPGGNPQHAPLKGRFETAPLPDRYVDVTFTVITGQAYKDLDDPIGFQIYPSMAKLQPKFIVPTGDTVYYDSDPPRARTVTLARHHWHRMYGLPRHVDFHLQVPGYWEKDDHDTLFDDCWPTMRPAAMLPLTFADGLRIFREQVPMGEKTYRTFRWGKAVQVWLVEGRDFRSPNSMPDGPGKTIWGGDQKKWLFDSLLKSDADWKILISPTPLVGPDRARGKNDNHANEAFQTEGDEIRDWFQNNLAENFFAACGDRHWQYHSVHPQTKVHEFSCGPASDQHAGGSPGEAPEYHRFHRVKGGFLSVTTRVMEGNSTIAFRFHDVHGEVVYEYNRQKPVR